MSLERLPLIYSPMGHAAGRRTPLRWRPAALILTLSLLPLAAVSLADPPWIAGVYDGGDCDDLLRQRIARGADCSRT